MTSFLQDLRLGARALRKRPGFTAAAVLALAVGIGADAALFSVANGLLFRPPVADSPQRIVNVHAESADGSGFHAFSYLDAIDLGEDDDTVLLAPWAMDVVSLSTARSGGGRAEVPAGGGEPRVAGGQMVGHRYFEVFGLPPTAGRYLDRELVRENSDVAVVSHRLARELTGGAPVSDAVGRTVRVNQRQLTVVGVAPEGFTGPFGAVATSVWIPLELQPLVKPGAELDRRAFVWLEMVARLAEGVDRQQAEAYLDGRFAHLVEQYPDSHRGDAGIHFSPFGQVPGQAQGGLRLFLAVLLAAVSLLLLVTCFDVAGMLLSRAAERRREIAVRLALGAGRLRLARQMVTENLLLFVLGGGAGLLLAYWATRIFAGISVPIPIELAIDVGLDLRVVVYTLGVTLAVGVLFGLTPAVYGTRLDLRAHLDDGSARGGSRLRGRRLLLVAQVAASMVLLAGSGLFLRALAAASDVDPGFDAENARMAELDLSVHGYEEDAGRDFFRRLQERVEPTPGVDSIGYLRMMHLGLGNMTTGFSIDGAEPPPGETSFPADYNVIGGDYFEALGVPLVAGRPFRASDADGPEVVIINQTVAQRFWPDENPVGRRLRLGSSTAAEAEIVGVAADAKYRSLGEEPRNYLYLPLSHNYEPAMTVVVRHDDGAGDVVAAALRAAIRELDRDLPVASEYAVADYIGISLLPQRIASAVTAVAGVVGLLLVGIGVYGITAFSVAQRTRELGVRRALGAERRDIVRLVVGEGVRLAAGGVAVGWLLSLGAGRLLQGLLPGVSPADPWVFGLVPLFLLAVVALGSLAPARRAVRVDPMTALRAE